MVQPYEVSVMRSHFTKCDTIYPLRVVPGDNNSVYFSGDYNGEIGPAPAGVKGWACAYAPVDAPHVAVPINRFGPLRYGNGGGGKLIMRASKRPLRGMVPLSSYLRAMFGKVHSVNPSAIAIPDIEGWVWPTGLSFDNFADFQTLSVTRAGQREDVTVSRIVGGQVSVWDTTVDGQTLGNTRHANDWGQALQYADRWTEVTSAGNIDHNPTQMGTAHTLNGVLQPPPPELGNLMCSPTVRFTVGSKYGDLDIFAEQIPLEFEKANYFHDIFGGPNQDHGGDDFHPVIYPELTHKTHVSVNYRGRTGVHRIRMASVWPSINGGQVSDFGVGSTMCWAHAPVYDKVEFYNPVTDVITPAVWPVTPSLSRAWTFVDGRAVVQDTVGGIPSPGTPYTDHFPQRVVACVYRATGTFYGAASPNALGMFGVITQQRSLRYQAGIGQFVFIGEYFTPGSFPTATGGVDGQFGCSTFVNMRGGFFRDPGAFGYQWFAITGRYADVYDRIRRLYLDGFTDPVWNGEDEA